jgi:hypothetical protein
MAVANIDEAITEAAVQIATASYDPTVSLLTQWNLWIAGTFGAAGVFPITPDSAANPARRSVLDWQPAHLIARDKIEGPGNTDTGPVGTSACADVCARLLSAVKFAVIAGEATAGEEADMVTLFNAVWP